MALAYNELKPGTIIVLEGDPWEVKEYDFLRMQQRKPVARTKLKNLISGRIQEITFHQQDAIEEAELVKMPTRFLFENRGAYWFDEAGNPKNRFSFTKEDLGDLTLFLKPQIEVKALKFGDKIINIELPPKVDYKVTEAPPAIRGNTAQGGSKMAVIESGAQISVPFFVETGDIIRVNTQTGQYAERVQKGS